MCYYSKNGTCMQDHMDTPSYLKYRWQTIHCTVSSLDKDGRVHKTVHLIKMSRVITQYSIVSSLDVYGMGDDTIVSLLDKDGKGDDITVHLKMAH